MPVRQFDMLMTCRSKRSTCQLYAGQRVRHVNDMPVIDMSMTCRSRVRHVNDMPVREFDMSMTCRSESSTCQMSMTCRSESSTCQMSMTCRSGSSTCQMSMTCRSGSSTCQMSMTCRSGSSTCQMSMTCRSGSSTCQVNILWLIIYAARHKTGWPSRGGLSRAHLVLNSNIYICCRSVNNFLEIVNSDKAKIAKKNKLLKVTITK